jgi:hypothetical protein
MGLTEAEHVFGGIHEDALNDLLRAFFSARPRHLHYGSPGFVAATNVNETQMGAIPFPGVPGGIDWAVRLDIPAVDLHAQTLALPPELHLGAGQLSVRTTVTLCMGCRHVRIDPRPPAQEHGEGGHRPPREDDDRKRREVHETCCRLEVHAIGHLERVLTASGEEAVVVAVDAVELVDVKPDELETILECLLLMVLRAVLANARLPLRALRAGAFTLVLLRGPEIEDDQVKVYGTL